jgi:hypothetical protein
MHFDLEQAVAFDIGQRLRALPTSGVAHMSWDEFIQRELLAQARLRFARRLQLTLVALVVVVVLSSIGLWSGAPTPQAMLARQATVSAMPGAYRLAPVAADEAAARAAASERWLAALPAEPVIVRVGTRAAVTNLEDRIAWVDDTLTLIDADGGEAARASALQHERYRLINSLAQVRYAETLAAHLP